MNNNEQSDEVNEARCRAEKFAAYHIGECVNEMLEWQDTTILRDGKIRELARLCYWADQHALRVAQAFIERAAYNFIDKAGIYSK